MSNQEGIVKVRKMCRNGPMCSWKPGCRYVHPEEGEMMPQRAQREPVFVMPDVTQPPPGYQLASNSDFPGLEQVGVRPSREEGDSLEADRSLVQPGLNNQ